MSKSKQDKRWKVPMPIKVAIGLFGTICLVMAILGSIVHTFFIIFGDQRV